MTTMIVHDRHEEEVITLLRSASVRVQIVSPWIKEPVLEPWLGRLDPGVKCRVLTRGRLEDFVQGASDLAAFQRLVDAGVSVHLRNDLHAKVYLADARIALVTSANLTPSGLSRNVEMGVLVRDREAVAELIHCVGGWFECSRQIDGDWLHRMRAAVTAWTGTTASRPRAEELEGPSGFGRAVPDHPTAESVPEVTAWEEPVGRYRDLPLPPEWAGILEPLLETAEKPLGAVENFELASLHEELLKVLIKKQPRVVKCRLELDLTGEQTGEVVGGISRQAVSNYEKTIVSRLRKRAPVAVGRLEAWLKAGDGPVVRSLSVAPRQRERAKVVLGLLGWLSGRDLRVQATSEGWTVFDRVERDALEKRIAELAAESVFMASEDLAESLGLDESTTRALVVVSSRVYMTASGLVGWSSWTNYQMAVAVARQLSTAGVEEWHASQLAKALALLDRERFGEWSAQDAIAIAGRPVTEFEFAGQRGTYRLREFGDGYRNNAEAVLRALGEVECPLHVEDLETALQRNMRPGTVVALLRRDASRFASFGGGVWGLKGMEVRPDSACERWLLGRLARQESLEWDSAVEEAGRDEIPVRLLRGTAAVSREVKFVSRRFGRPAYFRRRREDNERD